MSAISIQRGIVPQCKSMTHGAIAASVLSYLVKALLKGSEEQITLSELATMTASKLEDVVTTCRELEEKGLLAKSIEGPWEGVSSVIAHSIQIKLSVSQKDLFGSVGKPPEPKNPLGLFLNHDYKRVDGHGNMTFKGYQGQDEIYQFHSVALGGLRGDESWVRSIFDLVEVPQWDPKIPQEEGGLDLPELSDEGLRVKRVSPERFAEIVLVDSSKSLGKKNPTAKELVEFSDTQWVVTGLAGADSSRLIYLTPCTPAGTDDADGSFFKAGKNRFKLGAPETRIVLMEASVAEVVDDAPGAKADPLEWIKSFAARGYASSGSLSLKPKSFMAAITARHPDTNHSATVSFDLDGLTIVKDSVDGAEIDGYEEEAAAPAPQEQKIEVEEWTAWWPEEQYTDRGTVSVGYKQGFEPETDLFVFGWDGGYVNHRVPSKDVADDVPMGQIVEALVLSLLPTIENRSAPIKPADETGTEG